MTGIIIYFFVMDWKMGPPKEIVYATGMKWGDIHIIQSFPNTTRGYKLQLLATYRLACLTASGASYWRYSQTVTLLFQFSFRVDGHAYRRTFGKRRRAISVVIVIIAICDMPRQEFSLCEHMYIHNTYFVISVILLLFVQSFPIIIRGYTAGWLAEHHTDTAPKQSLCYFSSDSE